MDDVDRAKELEINQRKRSLDAALSAPDRNPGEEQLTDDAGNVHCLDCLSVIPEERIEAKPDAVRCIDCKQDWERNQK